MQTLLLFLPGILVCRPVSRALYRISGLVFARISSVLDPLVTLVDRQTPFPTLLNCNENRFYTLCSKKFFPKHFDASLRRKKIDELIIGYT